MTSEHGGSDSLGALYDPERHGTRFTVYCGARATGAALVFFKSIEDTRPLPEIALDPITDPGVFGGKGRLWSIFVEGIGPGQLYGYRVPGDWDPRNGARYNPYKVLLDPWGCALGRNLRWHEALFGYDRRAHGRSPDADLHMSKEDSAPFAPLAMVVGPSDYQWQSEGAPKFSWNQTVIYEAHVKGQTADLRAIPRRLRGTYLGLSAAAHQQHLRTLGVTSLELMPTHQAPPAGVEYSNYWGYDTLGFMLANREFSIFRRALDCNDEIREMADQLFVGDLEYLLDVVFNHTAEGDEYGPTLSLRGFANEDFYRLSAKHGDPYRGYMNHSGCGNTLNVSVPIVRRLILDALRWWRSEYRVSGERYDLADILHYGQTHFDAQSQFMVELEKEPDTVTRKLIAEPWDTSGHHLGHFRMPWREWNDKYRDDIRRFVRGDAGFLAAFAHRLHGSRSEFPEGSRGQCASINFITCHDGFTLHDLVTYAHKHNEVNGEGNRDGRDENYSANYGVEGETDDPQINALRRRQQRNFISILAFSNGVPMILGGDELDRSQAGNNNAYAHDNPLSWNYWPDQTHWLTDFFAGAFALRKRLTALQWATEVRWFAPGGEPMSDDYWNEPERRVLGVELPSYDLEAGCNCKVIILVNMHWERSCSFVLPGEPKGWCQLLDTHEERQWFDAKTHHSAVELAPRSIRLLIDGQ